MELDGYKYLEGENIATYDHMGKHLLWYNGSDQQGC